MKKIILFQLFMLISVITFGQSVTITPSQTTNSSNSSADNIVLKSNQVTNGIYGYLHNGTLASPTAVTSGQELFKINGGGSYSGSNFASAASLRFTSTENWSGSSNGARISFWTVPNGSFSLSERMTVNHDGKVGIGLSSPVSNLHIHQPTAATSYLRLSNSETGTTTSDGLEISMSNNVFLFGYQASIMNREAGSLSLGTNNLSRFYINSAGHITVGSFTGSAGLGRMIIEGNSTCCGAGNNFSTLTLHESDTEGSRLTFTNNNTTSDQRFWTVYGNPKTAGDEANAEMNFYYSTAVGAGNNVLRLLGNGNSEHQGYTKLGDTAPAIKMKELSGTTSGSSGGTVNIAHGLTLSKILSVSVLVNASTSNDIPPNYNGSFVGFQYFYFVGGTNVVIENSAGNHTNIAGRPVKILITYKE
jgi:hypothetical protein